MLGRSRWALFVLTLATALFGTTIELLNFAPTFVYVDLLARASRCCRSCSGTSGASSARGGRSPTRRCGCSSWTGARRGPCSSGRGAGGGIPAAAALFSFVALELAHPRPAYPRTLAIAIALYSYWALAGMAVYGRDAWTRYGEGFAVAFGLLSRIAPFAVRDGAVVVRWPFTGLARRRAHARHARLRRRDARLDELRRLQPHERRGRTCSANVRADLADSSQRTVDLATTFVERRRPRVLRRGGRRRRTSPRSRRPRRSAASTRSLVPDFVLPLVPIAAAYLVAHYFSLFLIQGQFIITLVSDPFGRGWDLFGTVDFAPNLAIVSPGDGVVRAGRGARRRARRRARDRARSGGGRLRGPADRARAQLPMLALMVLYTVGGMWLLTRG